jgi:hypothetical protein
MVGRLTERMPAGAVVGSRGNHDDYNNDAKGEFKAISKLIHVLWVIIGIHATAIHDPLIDLIHKHVQQAAYLGMIRGFVPTKSLKHHATVPWAFLFVFLVRGIGREIYREDQLGLYLV